MGNGTPPRTESVSRAQPVKHPKKLQSSNLHEKAMILLDSQPAQALVLGTVFHGMDGDTFDDGRAFDWVGSVKFIPVSHTRCSGPPPRDRLRHI